MAENDYQEMVEKVIEENRYLALSTTDGTEPWVATIEYIHDETGTFYFFSTTDSRHAEHIEQNETVAVAIWSTDQPEYSPNTSTNLYGVHIRGEAHRLSEDEYPDAVSAAIEALDPPMPPYAAFQIVPRTVYAPIIEDGVNKRVEVNLR
jgi:nitroimidazol reductase NimA-like FMN-containing flavoprotein (pyridoxamine 5'-phosphate oxidase superfamily)